MSKLRSNSRASAPAKVILFGEHFVIYNNPAILMSIDKRILVNAQLISDHGIHILSEFQEPLRCTFSGGKLNKFDEVGKSPLFPICDAILRSIPDKIHDTGIEISIESDIPIGVGLGSSAASCVATVAAVGNLFRNPDRRSICLKAMESEALIHKGSSGADCFAATYGGMIYYIKNRGFNRVKSHEKLHLLLINTGVKHSTWSMVSKVEDFKKQNISRFKEVCKRAYEICDKGRAALQSGDQEEIGILMNENHKLLQTVGASHEKVDELVELCNKNGALGSKLTGAGGGGSVIALVKERDYYRFTLELIGRKYEALPVTIDNIGLEIH